MKMSAALNPMSGSNNGAALVVREIEHALDAWRTRCAVEAVASTGSTNEDLVTLARAQQPSGYLLRATDFQTRGRGRRQRAWRAAPGDALLFSVAIPLARIPEALPAITLACGVALAERLAGHAIAVQLKWPNDIRAGGRKLAGILTELVADRSGRHTLVIGVGMNLHLDAVLSGALDQPAVALDQLTDAADVGSREQWIGRFGASIFDAAEQFVRGGFDPFCTRFNELLEARDTQVDVVGATDGDRRGARTISGRLIEVDRSGCLVIESEGRSHRVSVGDLVLQ